MDSDSKAAMEFNGEDYTEGPMTDEGGEYVEPESPIEEPEAIEVEDGADDDGMATDDEERERIRRRVAEKNRDLSIEIEENN